MLSVFPQLLFLSPFAATLIRIALAILFAYAAWDHVKRADIASRTLAIVEIAVAIALFLGAWTQPAALGATIVAAIWISQKTARPVSLSASLLALAMSFTLILTGAGAFAFDLPL